MNKFLSVNEYKLMTQQVSQLRNLESAYLTGSHSKDKLLNVTSSLRQRSERSQNTTL